MSSSPINVAKKGETILIALGGNALQVDENKANIALQEEFVVAQQGLKNIVDLIAYGHDKIVITHGNGPQVGRIFLQQELTKKEFPRQTTLDVCVADTQGRIGYILQNVFNNECKARGLNRSAYAVVTQVEVDKHDPAFKDPSKPIGAFYTDEEAAKLAAEYGWILKPQAKKGMRRVVPSPLPLDVVEKELIKQMLANGMIVIAGGGGGIPVIRNGSGGLVGVEAVIDKDRTSAMLANEIGIDVFVILTEADHVYLDYAKPTERALKRVSVSELEEYYQQGQFPAGSMGPKVEAVIDFIKRGGKHAIIASLFSLGDALAGKSGTHIVP
ncbi:MAG: carbamate kinase [Oligoflexia bacterium]|nr:carbamate kinase [Oligoflexia bacterium]MBF0367350.1 carbamate kinase [Oligoflexia bacterium]